MKLFFLTLAALLTFAGAAFAADNLPLKEGFRFGLEGSYNSLELGVKSFGGYPLHLSMAVAELGYAKGMFDLTVRGGLAKATVEGLIEPLGDVSDTSPMFGATLKILPYKGDRFQLGLVGTANRITDLEHNISGVVVGYPVDVHSEISKVWIFEGAVIGQYEVVDNTLAIYAGPKYRDVNATSAVAALYDIEGTPTLLANEARADNKNPLGAVVGLTYAPERAYIPAITAQGELFGSNAAAGLNLSWTF
ncbi:MAG TPA: hypothetical protein PKA31_02340 [Candidatus Moranbacteria bacterium]|nr:hypothetical protein [Candidatus Moranbacteria bacterium]